MGQPLFAAGRRSYAGGGVCWVGVGALPRGEAVEADSILVGQPLFAAGRRSYRGRVVCWAGVGAPPRGEAVEAGSIFVGQPLFAAGRRSYRGRVVCWIGVGAPPRGEAVEADSILVGQPLFAAGRRSYRAASFAGLVWEPRLGAKLWGCVRDCGIAAIVRGGAPLLHGRWRLLGWRGSPASGRSFGVALGIAG